MTPLSYLNVICYSPPHILRVKGFYHALYQYPRRHRPDHLQGCRHDGTGLGRRPAPAAILSGHHREQLESWRGLSYQELAFEVISRFVDDIPAADLKSLINRSYATFTHPEVTPVVKHNGVYILELFHGVTLAFKDVALQFLGNLFEYILAERHQTLNILGATSGDTGSAAIHGVRGKKGISIFILHPLWQDLRGTGAADDLRHRRQCS